MTLPNSFWTKAFPFVLSFLFLFPFLIQAKIHYVSVSSSGMADGSSWENASSDLQQVLDEAQAGDSVFVSQGVYVPPYSCTDESNREDAGRDNSFVLRSGIALFGGFDPEEAPDMTSRDWKRYPAVLSGRFGEGELDLSYQLLFVVGITDFLIDGFELRESRANESSVSCFVNGVQIYRNSASAIYTESSTGTFRNLYVHDNQNPSTGSNFLLKASDITVANVKVMDNQAHVGGGLYALNATFRLFNSWFEGNTAKPHGGAVDLSTSHGTIVNSVFLNNQVTNGTGGAIYMNAASSLVVVNSTFVGNSVTNTGGGIYTFTTKGATPAILHNTLLYNNRTSDKTGKPVIDNAVLHANATVTHSFIQQKFPAGTNNIDDRQTTTDPCFVSESENLLRLRHESPLINAGDYTAYANYIEEAYNYDFQQNPRLYGGRIDIGAYEYQPSSWTGSTSPDWNDAGNWSSLAVPRYGDEVLLPEGRAYYPELHPEDQASCHSIRFGMGSALGNQHLLNYDKAFVELNFGYYEETNGNFGSELQDRTASGNCLQRDRDYLLSAPLQNTVSGDYFLGGKPNVYASYADISTTATNNSLSPGWTTIHFTHPLPDYTVPLGFADGFAFWVNPSLAKRNETGGTSIPLVYDQANLNKHRGIMQFPRIPYYIDYNPYEFFDPDTHTSGFYYFQKGLPDQPDVNRAPDLFSRTLYDEANSIYHANRFITEIGDIEAGITVSKKKTRLPDGSDADVLIGNPFMGYFDFPAFYKANKDRICPYYRLWDGVKVISFFYDEQTDEVFSDQPEADIHILPMHAFLVLPQPATKDEETLDLRFDASMAYANKPSGRLRKASQEEHVAWITLSGSRYESSVAICLLDNDLPLPKLFSGESNLPELYLGKKESTEKYAFLSVLPGGFYELGIRSDSQETFSIRLEGQLPDAYRLILSDNETGNSYDLSSPQAHYSFKKGKLSLENRFSLRIQDGTTATDNMSPESETITRVQVQDKTISVTSNSPIQSLRLVDLSGRTLYYREKIARECFLFPFAGITGIGLLSVQTEKGVTVHKLVF